MMKVTLSESSFLFLGAGNMAEAMIRGLCGTKVVDPSKIVVLNRSDAAKLAGLAERYGVRTGSAANDLAAAVSEADVLVLAMKPKDASDALRRLAPHVRDSQLIVSVIAGLSIATIQRVLGRRPVVRTMPNTSSTIGLGATGIAFSPEVTESQAELAQAMFRATGVAAIVDESRIDAINALSGSGPAYAYYLMEAMIEEAHAQGLAEAQARELAAQTLLGAAAMVLRTGERPEELRRKVTSTNGTTQAAIEVMERCGFRQAVRRAMRRCAERAREMGADIDAQIAEPDGHNSKESGEIGR